ncbi:MAG: DUF2225 domain-containing protein [bacterium]
MESHIYYLLFNVLILISIGFLFATTWMPQDFICPICGKENTFNAIASYGSYIYQWESKFQYIFWPLIDFNVMYSCMKCHFTVFMWDFDKVPSNKIDAVKEVLKNEKLEKEYKEYYEIPMSERLEIAENIYKVLGKDDHFWCQFYRVMGYHYDKEDMKEKTDFARNRSLTIAQQMIEKSENEGIKKELLLIIGAMLHYLQDDKGALNAFRKAQNLKYENKNLTDEQNKNINEYLTGLLDEYVKKIEKPEAEGQ